jgi:hypothetical protein
MVQQSRAECQEASSPEIMIFSSFIDSFICRLNHTIAYMIGVFFYSLWFLQDSPIFSTIYLSRSSQVNVYIAYFFPSSYQPLQ